MSVPRRKPPSTITGARPATPATTSGTHSMVARRLFSARPPWFDTNNPLTPFSIASSASSRVTMPLSRTFMLVVSLSRLMNSQLGVPTSGIGVPGAICASIGRRRLSASSTRPLLPGAGLPPR
jgi:hypothetical protein